MALTKFLVCSKCGRHIEAWNWSALVRCSTCKTYSVPGHHGETIVTLRKIKWAENFEVRT